MKKYIKVFVAILCLYILTGCSATYKVNVKNKNITDELLIENESLTEEQIDAFTKNVIPISINNACFLDYDNVSEYDTKKLKGVKYYKVTAPTEKSLKFESKVTTKEYNDMRMARYLFNSFNVNSYPDMFSIYGYDGITAFENYPELDSINIEITVDKKVVKHNADSVIGNTYTWNFNKDSKKNKTLYIETNPTKSATGEVGYTILAIILGVIVIVTILIISTIYIKSSRRKFN